MMHGQERTFLKVFIEVPEPTTKSRDDLKSDSPNSGPSYLNTPPSSSSKPKSGSFTNHVSLRRDKSDPPFPSSSSSSSQTSAQYTIVTITSQSSAADVCAAVARKRNLLYSEDEYELVMCDGDGKASYETRLNPEDQPHQFQQSAAKHGHLGDFHFVFRKHSEDDQSDGDETDQDDSEPDIFGTNLPQQVKVYISLHIYPCTHCVIYDI